ncbi:FxsA family protein [Helicobacter labacensis]|uniref:FxsA family protein n=1 Tax=Helicobacter labacensis TaxID=2316079 RepID=UPI000EB59ADF|nr:FxsA family protein [Helicobacter labacensis]
MPFLLVLGVFYLVVEVVLIINVVQDFGLFAFILEVVLSAFAGGVALFKGSLKALDFSTRDPLKLMEGVFLRTIGGLLLILPGVLCDVFGLLALLIAWLRKPPQRDDGIIDVEVLDKDKDGR